MAALFEAYITNLGKYNEGELVGETLKFPTTTEEVQALLKRIGVDAPMTRYWGPPTSPCSAMSGSGTRSAGRDFSMQTEPR